MKGVNKVTILGHLGKDPEVKYFPSGDAVCNVSVATSESWIDKSSGEKKTSTEWHNLVFTKKLAEIVGQYLKKGSKVYVEGSLRTRKWEKDGKDHYTTEIVGHEMQMLGGKADGAAPTQPAPAAEPAAAQFESDAGFSDEDIAF